MNNIQLLTEALATTIEKLYSVSMPASQIALQQTRSEFEGDYTYVVFPLLKSSRKKPFETADELGKALLSNTDLVTSYQAVNGFLNISLSSEAYLKQFAQQREEPNFGHKTIEENAPTVMIEYSSPNTNKPLHLGHIRNNLLGYSLACILQANGNKVVKTNIVNDRGIHICKSMVAWLHWGNGATPQSTHKKGDHLVGDFYVMFDKHYKEEIKNLMEQGLSEEAAKEEAPLMQEARAMLRKWELGDADVMALWRNMNQWVYDGFDETYQRLGVNFDKIYYESDTYLVGREEVLRGLKEGKFVKHDDGSVWADLTSDGLDEKLLLRSDGTSVYMTQDIGTAKMRYNDFPIDKMIYVVGNEQEYHFKVLSLLLDKLGFAFGKSLVHFSYGMVNLPEGRMKSREGTVVDADDLMDDMIANARQISEESGKSADFDEAEKADIACKVGLGALKYFILKVDPRKNMTFNPKESIDFNGNTASFIQYTYARIKSLQQKAGNSEYAFAMSTQLNKQERDLLRSIAEYPAIVKQAGDELSPAVIANYTYDLVKLYNGFYHDCPILREEDSDKKNLRLAISDMVANVVQRGMALLGIEMPQRM